MLYMDQTARQSGEGGVTTPQAPPAAGPASTSVEAAEPAADPSRPSGSAGSADSPDRLRLRSVAAPDAVAGPVQRLSGPRQRLDRLSTVRPGTVVVLLKADEAPEVKHPGELMIPSWWPPRGGRDAVVVNTEPVNLRVAVHDLLTLDGEDLASVEVEVVVRVQQPHLPGLVAQYGAELGPRLVEAAERSIESSVRAAVGMNRAADLRRQSLRQVLTDRWLPKSFAQGALSREELRLGAMVWSDELEQQHADEEHAVPEPAEQERREQDRPAQELDAQEHDAHKHDGRDRAAQKHDEQGRTDVQDRDEATVLLPQPLLRESRIELEPKVSETRRAAGDETLLLVGSLGRDDRHAAHRSGTEALRLVHLPLVISAGAFWLFFISYWVPELGSLPGAHFMLEQFAPLASKELTSESRPLVESQQGHLGLSAALVLIVAVLIPVLARSRWWLARLALWPLTYLAAISAVVTLIGVLVRGQLGVNLLGLLLLVVWVASAALTTWRSLWVDVDTLPARPARVGWLIAAFALFNPAPVTLGRAWFAPELRSAAESVVHNDLTLRWAALLTPATALVYLCGVLVALVAWAAYLLWPPRQVDRRTVPVVGLVLALVAVLLIGPQAAAAGADRAAVIASASPRDEIGLTCGSWVHQLKGRPARTLVVSGLSCRRITAFAGYDEVSTRATADSLSPVNAGTLLGRRIERKLVGAAYGDMVVLASTDRVDNHATALVGLRMSDAAEVWRYRCPVAGSMTLRFIDSSEGDDSTAGRLTLRGEKAAVAVDCGAGTVRLDPRTGRAV